MVSLSFSLAISDVHLANSKADRFVAPRNYLSILFLSSDSTLMKLLCIVRRLVKENKLN